MPDDPYEVVLTLLWGRFDLLELECCYTSGLGIKRRIPTFQENTILLRQRISIGVAVV
jgi:hypothetical protein